MIFRKLVGLVAQTLSLGEMTKVTKAELGLELNLCKSQMARCIANQLFAENIPDK